MEAEDRGRGLSTSTPSILEAASTSSSSTTRPEGLWTRLGTSLSASEQEKLPTSDFFFFNLDLSLNPEEEYRKPTGGGYRKRMHFVPFLNRLEEHYFFGGFFFLNFEI